MLSESAPIPALPLEYDSTGSEIFRPIFRAFSILFVVVGAALLITDGSAIASLWQNLSGQNWPLRVGYAMGLPVASLQLVAGLMNARNPVHLQLFRIWAWCAIGNAALEGVLIQYWQIVLVGRGHLVFNQLFLMLLAQVLRIVISAALPVAILILLRFHSRKIART